jgi:hypothetical protein
MCNYLPCKVGLISKILNIYKIIAKLFVKNRRLSGCGVAKWLGWGVTKWLAGPVCRRFPGSILDQAPWGGGGDYSLR